MSDTPKTDERTYSADCLGKTPVVNADWAKLLERENAALRADLDWLDKHLDSFACQQLFGEEQDVGKLREMIAKERKLEEKL